MSKVKVKCPARLSSAADMLLCTVDVGSCAVVAMMVVVVSSNWVVAGRRSATVRMPLGAF